jgi:outer membrane protein OmpA-like peptidoglycan-associated protein
MIGVYLFVGFVDPRTVQAEKFGMGLELGLLKNSVSESDVNSRLRELGSNGDAKIDSSMGAFYRLFGFYQPFDFLVFEAGINRANSKEVLLTNIGSLQASQIIEDLPIVGTGLDLRGLYQWNINSRWAILAGLGLWRWSTSVELTLSNTMNEASKSGTDPTIHLYGIYKQPFKRLKALDLRLQLSRYYALEQTNDVISLAALWSFGVEDKALSRGQRSRQRRMRRLRQQRRKRAIKRKRLQQLRTEKVTYKRVKLRGNKITTTEKIMFDLGKAQIKPESFYLLNEVVTLLNQRKDILKVQIEGHTDSIGKRRDNARLSSLRASSVRQYLVNRGIESGRLRAIGFGESRPIATNKNSYGREVNRRVEFTILKWSKKKR